MRKTLEQRFWEKVDKRSNDECWKWIASKAKSGHGWIRINRKTRQSHCLSYILHFGEIPANKQINHKCNNASCVNPYHLYAGTKKDNTHDSIKCGTFLTPVGQNGELNIQAKLNKQKTIEIKKMYSTGKYSQLELAKIFGINQSNISRIITNKAWK